jgi:hypothetical protein
LLDAVAVLNTTDHYGQSPLYQALRNNRPVMARMVNG